MGRRGPKPKPTALKVAAGVRSDRINMDEPKPVAGDPVPNVALTADAQAEWDRMIPILREMGVLSRGDGAALSVYCTTYADWIAARREIDALGVVVLDYMDRPKANPAVGQAAKCVDVMTKYLREFGLTPSARSSIKAEPTGADEDELEAFKRRRTNA